MQLSKSAFAVELCVNLFFGFWNVLTKVLRESAFRFQAFIAKVLCKLIFSEKTFFSALVFRKNLRMREFNNFYAEFSSEEETSLTRMTIYMLFC